MEIKVYYGLNIRDENTQIGVLKDFEHNADSDTKTAVVEEATTLSDLYKDGWRLAQVVPAHISHGSFFFFMEK